MCIIRQTVAVCRRVFSLLYNCLHCFISIWNGFCCTTEEIKLHNEFETTKIYSFENVTQPQTKILKCCIVRPVIMVENREKYVEQEYCALDSRDSDVEYETKDHNNNAGPTLKERNALAACCQCPSVDITWLMVHEKASMAFCAQCTVYDVCALVMFCCFSPYWLALPLLPHLLYLFVLCVALPSIIPSNIIFVFVLFYYFFYIHEWWDSIATCTSAPSML